MVAYKKIDPRRTDADFSKLESKDLPQSKNKKLAITYFFTGHTLFTTLLTGLFHSPISDADAVSDASDTDCDIDNASERKTKLNGWQYFIHKKLVRNFYCVSLSLKSPPFLFFLEV